ncbi:MAG: hypothetical protein N3E40_00625, partial [Dehalococcoidia bacterium]|nr:hypothetical protein [Dehalococcoidia bacterium]
PNLRDISEAYFNKYGRGHFIRMAIDRILQKGWKLAGISGIRSPEDVSILRNILGQDFILIAVTVADPNTRYKRMLKRGEDRDHNSIEQFQKQDEAEESLFHISTAMAQADYTISNDSSIDALYSAIDTIISTQGLWREQETGSGP